MEYGRKTRDSFSFRSFQPDCGRKAPDRCEWRPRGVVARALDILMAPGLFAPNEGNKQEGTAARVSGRLSTWREKGSLRSLTSPSCARRWFAGQRATTLIHHPGPGAGILIRGRTMSRGRRGDRDKSKRRFVDAFRTANCQGARRRMSDATMPCSDCRLGGTDRTLCQDRGRGRRGKDQHVAMRSENNLTEAFE